MTVMMQTVMLEKVFFKIPKELGFFDDIKLLRKRYRKSLGITPSMCEKDALDMEESFKSLQTSLLDSVNEHSDDESRSSNSSKKSVSKQE